MMNLASRIGGRGKLTGQRCFVPWSCAMLTVGAEKPLGRLLKHAWSCGKFDVTDAHLAAVFRARAATRQARDPECRDFEVAESLPSPHWKVA